MTPLDELQTPHAFAITPSNDNDLAYVARVIYVGTGGNLEIITRGGETVVLKNLPSGAVIDWVRVARVKAANTTATDLVGFW